MATLSGFTRPTDPINAVDMALAITTAIGKTVTCEITATDVLVTGATISGADTSNIQVAMTAYQYGYLQYGAPISDLTDMSTARHDRGITERVAYAGDTATYNAAKLKIYVTGALKTGSTIYSSKASTAGGSGNVTFYVTSDGTSSGTAIFNNIYADSIIVVAYGSSGSYQPYNVTVAGDKKSISATISQITNVLSIATISSAAANGIDCRLYAMGD